MNDEQSAKVQVALADSAPTSQKVLAAKWRNRLQKLVWPLHARFPNAFRSLYGDHRSEDWADDAQDNKDSELEEESELKLACVVVSEIYGPNEIESLYIGLAKIGWDKDVYNTQRESNIDWLKRQRLYGSEGRLSFGRVVRPADVGKYLGVRYLADFPEEFSSLSVVVTQLTPSITCLTVAFILSDDLSLEYKREINRPANTVFVPMKRAVSYSIKSVEHVKDARVVLARSRFLKASTLWLEEHFAGFFANQREQRFPTAEILSVDGFEPFGARTQRLRGWMHWSRFVNIDEDFWAWTCTSVPSLKFKFGVEGLGQSPRHITVALRRDSLGGDNEELIDGSLGAQAVFAQKTMGGVIPKYALSCYLLELLRNLKETRQSLSGRARTQNKASQFGRVSEFFGRSIGVPSIAREVLALSESDYSFQRDATGFTQRLSRDDDSVRDIKDLLKMSLGRISKRLLEEDRDTREFLNQLSSAMGTKESVSAQRRMEAVAVLALIVSVVSLIVAL